METVERTLIEGRECTDVLMLLAAVRGGIDALMPRCWRITSPAPGGPKSKALTPELGEELIDVVRAYMK